MRTVVFDKASEIKLVIKRGDELTEFIFSSEDPLSIKIKNEIREKEPENGGFVEAEPTGFITVEIRGRLKS